MYVCMYIYIYIYIIIIIIIIIISRSLLYLYDNYNRPTAFCSFVSAVEYGGSLIGLGGSGQI